MPNIASKIVPGGSFYAVDADQVEETTDAKVMTGAERTKLDGIEAGATGDQTGAEIKAAYEAEDDTNAFTDADQAALASAGIPTESLERGFGTFSAPDTPATQNFYRVDALPLEYGGTLDTVDIYANADGSVTIYVYEKTGDDFAPYASKSVAVSSGLNSDLEVGLVVPVGGYVGANIASVNQGDDNWGGSDGRYIGATESFTDASPSSSGSDALITFHCTDRTHESVNAIYDETQDALDTKLDETAVRKLTLPLSSVVAGSESDDFDTPGSTMASGSPFRVPDRVFPRGGTLETVDVHMASAGTLDVYVYEKTGDDFAPHASKSVAVSAGLNQSLAVDLDIPVGGYVGVNVNGTSEAPSGWPRDRYFGAAESFTHNSPSGSGGDGLVTFNCTEFVHETATDTYDALGLEHQLNLLRGTTIPFIGLNGQSNAVGENTASTNRAEFSAMSFDANDDVMVPAQAPDAGANEFPSLGAAAYFNRAAMFNGAILNQNGGYVVAGHAGTNGMEISGISTNASVEQLAATVAAAGDVRVVHPGQIFFQGEADAIAGTTRADYKAFLLALAQDYNVDSREVCAGSYDRITFAVQISSAPGYADIDDGWEIAMAQLEASEDSDLVGLVGPGYAISYDDSRHVDSAGSRAIGARAGRALYHYAVTGAKLRPLRAVDWYIDGDDVVILYNRKVSLDTTLISSQVQSGFSVYTSGAVEVSVNNVSVSDNEVRLTCASTPLAGHYWRYGYNSVTGEGSYTGGGGNLRDSAGDVDTLDGEPLHNWAVLQEGAL